MIHRYSKEEFHEMYRNTNGFNDNLICTPPIRSSEMSFEQFVDEGSKLLLRDHPDFVKSLH